jgi:hypothetical protein
MTQREEIKSFTAQATRINDLAARMGNKVGTGIQGAVMTDVSIAIMDGLVAVAAGDTAKAEAALIRAHNRAHNCRSGNRCADW